MSTRHRLLPASVTGLAVVLPLVVSIAAARQGDAPLSMSSQLLDLSRVEVLELEPISRSEAVRQDELAATTAGPQRFALPVDLALGSDTHGTWELLATGDRIWRLRVHAPGATDLNFGFGRYLLPPGAKLHILSEEERFYQGPYTDVDNRMHGQLWTPVVPGERAVLELFVPAAAPFEPVLELARVGRGYRDLFGRLPRTKEGHGACNNDVICPEGDPWRDEIRSVARYSISGIGLCTGTMIMNVPRDFTPFFLTADHCGVSAANDHTIVAYWNYEAPVCGQQGGGSLTETTTGTIFRADDAPNDMTLLEFTAAPDPAYNVYWSGWDATGAVPQGSVGIHHPSGEVKSISFNTDALSTINSCIGGGGSNTHWLVDDWEDGTTEPGSSGSGLWDPATHLLVGYLSGGSASCTSITLDCYGKFSVGWGAGLSAWLDPDSTGTMMVPGADPDSGGPIFSDGFEDPLKPSP